MHDTSAARSRPTLRITWLEVGPRTFYLIARCNACELMVEREMEDIEDDAVLDAIGTELLGAKGCTHVASGVGSGVRPAFKKKR